MAPVNQQVKPKFRNSMWIKGNGEILLVRMMRAVTAHQLPIYRHGIKAEKDYKHGLEGRTVACFGVYGKLLQWIKG